MTSAPSTRSLTSAGGRGHLLTAVLDVVPPTQGILFDLPDVIATVDINHYRLAAQPGDFFTDPLPTADAYILMEVIDDWPDAEATSILDAIRCAASPGARVLIVENVLDDAQPDPRGYTLDVIMLAVTGGRERTGKQLGGLLAGAGLANITVTATSGPMRIVEAMAPDQDAADAWPHARRDCRTSPDAGGPNHARSWSVK